MGVKNRISNLYRKNRVGHIILFIPFLLVKKILYFPKLISNIFFSYFYYNSLRIMRLNDIKRSIYYLGMLNTTFPHPLGIVIGKGVKIGKNCTIYQHVTLGAKTIDSANENKYPTIGNNVIIYANALVIGDINIGDNVIIGGSAIVTKDIPDNSIVIGNSQIKKIQCI